MDLYGVMVAASPQLQRGRVWCHACGRMEAVESAACLRSGWPRCCGATMSLDSPKEHARLRAPNLAKED